MTLSLTSRDLALAQPDRHFIGGTCQSPSSDARVTVISPSDECIVADLPALSPADVDKAVAAARQPFDDSPWPNLPLSERVSALRRFTEALLSRTEQIGLARVLECGPTVAFREAINGVVAPTFYENMYGFAESVPMSEERTSFAGPVTVARETYRVVVTILAYSGPLACLGTKVLPALLSGNAVVLKLPVETRLVAQHVAQAAEEADLPSGVPSVLSSGAGAGKYLVEHAGIDMVSFTGGTAVGAQILHSTADPVVGTTLELDGQ
jgi:aldehyde dehydrogenase (NAD+)